jgi:hypothetical protein
MLRVRAIIDQRDAELVFEPGRKTTEIRLVSLPGLPLYPLKDPEFIEGAQSELPHPRLSVNGGGEIVTDPQDKSGTKTETPQFELWVTVANPDAIYLPGQGASVRVRLENASLLRQWTRRFYQLLRNRSSTKWL